MTVTVPEREAFAVRVSSVSRQSTMRAAGIPPTLTVGEFVQGLIPKMELPPTDPEGRRIAYHALLEREGRHLHAAEIVGDVLQPDDHLVLAPNIMAGAW